MKIYAQKQNQSQRHKSYGNTVRSAKPAAIHAVDSVVSAQRAIRNQAVEPLLAAPSIANGGPCSFAQPLDTSTRAFLEPRVGHDFRQVRVHHDAQNAELGETAHSLAHNSGLANRSVLAAQPHYPAEPVPRRPRLMLYPKLMQDKGQTDSGRMPGGVGEWWPAETVVLEPGEVNEWGEMDGKLTSNVKPHLFINGGKTGSGIVQWVPGGNGGQGNQTLGDVDIWSPDYVTEDAADAGAEHATAWVWIKPKTGTAKVTRSYRGVQVGANTTAHYFTERAAARADVHEQLHVASSEAIHDKHIVPLEKRIAKYVGRENALKQGCTPEEAIDALMVIINWNDTMTAFRDDDTTANTPMGTVDTADLAAADFIRNYGPRKVEDVEYDSYWDTPPGPKND
jgi:Domain of unknown function (DUF4157)